MMFDACDEVTPDHDLPEAADAILDQCKFKYRLQGYRPTPQRLRTERSSKTLTFCNTGSKRFAFWNGCYKLPYVLERRF